MAFFGDIPKLLSLLQQIMSNPAADAAALRSLESEKQELRSGIPSSDMSYYTEDCASVLWTRRARVGRRLPMGLLIGNLSQNQDNINSE